MDDTKFLHWIYNRMVHQHNEKEDCDYMLKFKALLDTVKVVKEKCNLQNVTNRALKLQVKQLEARNELLNFMVENGLGAEDMINDITYPC